ncbi:ABC transporter ATP-binding protein [Rhodovibrio salinarum]|uniref:ABC transporter ATP-binding protein n=1 Tax=Rhodovibrio salinarum TaxID=1087 RepID=A0A934QJM9_9PROT|nr:ABC transporter ATP-binding protein [Rhodovibrio salinarum]MBK1698103.1 ABC transporter ATP-binding protein [Rhodovibrio salinarum]
MLKVRDLDVFYGRAQVLFGVGFEVPAGGVTALMGRNGAGKSTTMKALMGLVPSARGEVSLDGRRIDGWPPFRIARAGLGYVAEERRIFPDMTVAENLEVGRRDPADGRAPWTVAEVERLFPNLAQLRDRRAGQTSGGEQQMLAVARTLMGNPRLLLLDEPSEGLAPVIVQQMAAAVRALKAGGVTVLLSEQNLRFAGAVADRAVVLEKGAVRFSGVMAELAEDAELRRAYLAV